jgi:hypothetical protein
VGKLNAVETVSKQAFYIVVFVMTAILTIAELWIWRIVSVAQPPVPYFISVYGLSMVNALFSAFAADGYFKRIGLSRSGNSVELRDRMLANPEGLVPDDAVVEFCLDRSSVRRNLIACGIACVLAMVLNHYLPDESAWRLLASSILILSLGCALQQLLAWDGCLVRADRQGIFGYASRSAFRRTLLPWSEIAVCEIVTHRDTFGTPLHIVPVFKDEFGRTLMRVNLWSVPIEYQQRLVSCIRAKLPKARIDFTE